MRNKINIEGGWGRGIKIVCMHLFANKKVADLDRFVGDGEW